jgi:two-component system, chemotaxis family, chemotaxis protein CheY
MNQSISALIVDDDSMMRSYLRTILNESGIVEIEETGSGEAALRNLQQKVPQLLLLDINLPDKNGIDVLKEVRIDYPKLHVIMISGELTSERAKDCLEYGAKGFIVKPFNAAVVLRYIEKVVGKLPG